jgi:hypothetical protein
VQAGVWRLWVSFWAGSCAGGSPPGRGDGGGRCSAGRGTRGAAVANSGTVAHHLADTCGMFLSGRVVHQMGAAHKC